jgi:hypothetical protein
MTQQASSLSRRLRLPFVGALLATSLVTGVALAKPPSDAPGRGERAARHFDRMDLDGDGVVTRKEARESCDRRFSKADANGDGKITREEARAAAEARRAERQRQAKAD